MSSSCAPCLGQVDPSTPLPADIHTLQLLLIKPSKYDDDGYVVRFFRGVLPSNTLATLAGLTEEVVARGELKGVDVKLVMMDELVQKIDPVKLARRYKRPGVRVVAALAGVQTNQFPRAADLARQFQAAGVDVMMGGFHVSGSIAMSLSGIPPECQALIDEGITLVKGEVEEHWGDLLRDAVHGKMATYYNIVEAPDLSKATIPVVNPKLMKHFAYPYMGTIDAGRGCPFNCSFCTIINVQGRKMRNRLAAMIKERIRSNYANKIDYYFFTDDNFARNPNWEDIFDAIIELREQENIKVGFMMQVDTQSYRIKNFMTKAQQAGCSQVFIGMESINEKNLAAAGKKQNRVQDFAMMIDEWHQHGMACHVGYIIGFPFDTVESVREDVQRLRDEIKVDQASFFMLTPLPGSKDHQDMVKAGAWMDDDYNRFDSFHATTQHPNMGMQDWFDVYQEAWREFYGTDAMKRVLERANNNTYWGLFKNFVWYKYSTQIEKLHPMICGFLRKKDRTERRPGYATASAWAHTRMRASELFQTAVACARLYFEMQEVWLATRGRVQFEQNMQGLRDRAQQAREAAGNVASQAAASAVSAATAAKARGEVVLEHQKENMRRAGEALGRNVTRVRTRSARTRAHLNAYWKQTWDKVKTGRWFQINPFTVCMNGLRDLRLCMAFTFSFLGGYGK